MLEIPEALTLAKQLNCTVRGKLILELEVTAGYSPHKFAWYHGDPSGYHDLLVGRKIGKTMAYGAMVEITSDDALILFGEGVSIRYHEQDEQRPLKHQLLIEFTDGSAISASIRMYGGLWCFTNGDFDNHYYIIAKQKPSPLSEEFNMEYFADLTDVPAMQKLSVKAFLATEQRVPGLGNGVLQDILYNARIHPRRKMSTLTMLDTQSLFDSIKTTLAEMVELGGRDIEKNLFGRPGGYQTKLSAKAHGKPCQQCGSIIQKENYLGGSIYYCDVCQAL